MIARLLLTATLLASVASDAYDEPPPTYGCYKGYCWARCNEPFGVIAAVLVYFGDAVLEAIYDVNIVTAPTHLKLPFCYTSESPFVGHWSDDYVQCEEEKEHLYDSCYRYKENSCASSCSH